MPCPTQYSHLYLCLAGQLAAVICIHDPLRAEAKDAIRALHDCGIRKVVMMTGDNRRTAACCGGGGRSGRVPRRGPAGG